MSEEIDAKVDAILNKKGTNYIRNILLIFLGAALFIIGALTVKVYYAQPLQLQVENLEKQLEEEKQKNRVYVLRDDRRRCIAKTLVLAYNISKWEAFCYAFLFDEFSILYKIDWELYAALIRVETNFDPTRKSAANCKGLMQIKESTGKEVANKLNIKFKENRTLWNEFINYAIGATYLSEFVVERGPYGGIKSYLGGPDYKKSVKKKVETFQYVKEYKTRVSEEYRQLKYMYRGIVDEYSITDFKEINNSIHNDTTALIFDIFEVTVPDSIKEKVSKE